MYRDRWDERILFLGYDWVRVWGQVGRNQTLRCRAQVGGSMALLRDKLLENSVE